MAGEYLQDPDFQNLPDPEKHKFLMAADPDYAGLPPDEQTKFRSSFNPSPAAQISANPPAVPKPKTPPMEKSALGTAYNVGKTGFEDVSSGFGYGMDQLDQAVKGALSTPPQHEGMAAATGRAYKSAASMLNPMNLVPPASKPHEGIAERGAETAGNVLFNALLAKGFGGEPGEADIPESPTGSQTRAMRKAIRPSDKNLQFEQNFKTAYPAIQDEIAKTGMPQTLQEFEGLLRNAKTKFWGQYNDLLSAASKFRNKIRGALPPASTDIETGVQQARGGETGGVMPAESRSVPFTEKGADVGQLPLANTQYLSGGAHPELSGDLTNPALMHTADTAKIAATRDRLGAIVNNPQHLTSFSPSEQSAILGQYQRLNKILEPGPKIPYGPTIDGNKVADAIHASVSKRQELLNPGAAARIHEFAETYRRPVPLQEAEEFLQGANSDSGPWYQAAKKDPQASPHLLATVAEGNALRKGLYSKLDEISDPGTAAQLKKTYGALNSLHEATTKRIPIYERQAPVSLGEELNYPSGIYHFLRHPLLGSVQLGAAALAHFLKKPSTQIKEALSPASEGMFPKMMRAAQGTPGKTPVIGSLANSVRKANE